MPKKVLLVGHCGPDRSYLRMAVKSARSDVTLLTADDPESMTQTLSGGPDLGVWNCPHAVPQGRVVEVLQPIGAQMIGLGDTWRDQEHAKFVQEFELTMNAIESFTETAEQHIPFLLRKADRIDEYLGQK